MVSFQDSGDGSTPYWPSEHYFRRLHPFHGPSFLCGEPATILDFGRLERFLPAPTRPVPVSVSPDTDSGNSLGLPASSGLSSSAVQVLEALLPPGVPCGPFRVCSTAEDGSLATTFPREVFAL